MSTKSKSLYLLLVGILLLQACSMSQVQPTPAQPTQTPVPPTPTQPSPTPTEPPFEPIHLGMVWPANGTKLVGGAVTPDGIIYAMDENGMLHALGSSGKEYWTYQGDYNHASPPYLSKSLIYIFTDNQNLIAINYEGKEKWKFDIKGRVISAPLLVPDGSIYVEIYDNTKEGFKSDIYHLRIDGAYEKFSLEFLRSLDGALLDSKGNIYIWSWKALTVLSPSGEKIKECDQKGSSRLASNLVFGADDVLLYIIENSYLMAMGPDCDALWNVPLDKKEGNDLHYQMAYDKNDVLYIGGSDGSMYALDGKSGSILWKSETHPEIGEIVKIVPLEDGLVYVVTSQAKIAAFDSQGEIKWFSELYGPGVPDGLHALPTNEIVLFHGGQALIYTYNPAAQYEFPVAATPPASEEQAREEIVSFVLDFIVKYEIGETADYIRTSGMPWVDSPPEANIIVYAPAVEPTEDNYWSYIDSDNPIRVWWYADNKLTEVGEKQKAIDEYRKKYIDNSSGTIFVWGSYDFGIIKVNPDFRSAEIYVGASCGPLCGHGYLYWLQRSSSGEWWIYDSQHLWQS